MMGYVKVHQSMESYVKPIMYGIIKYVRYLMVFQAVSVGVSQVMSNYARVVLRFNIVCYGCFVYQDILRECCGMISVIRVSDMLRMILFVYI